MTDTSKEAVARLAADLPDSQPRSPNVMRAADTLNKLAQERDFAHRAGWDAAIEAARGACLAKAAANISSQGQYINAGFAIRALPYEEPTNEL